MKKLFLGVLISLNAFTSPVFAGGNIEAGKAKSVICAACHGANGIAIMPIYPNLKGQSEQYLTSSLKAYKNKERNGGQAAIMQPQASMLSDEDIANVAAYYSSLK